MAQPATPAQRKQFEGHDVELHKCSFQGTFDLENDESQAIALDRVVVFLVAGRVTGAGFELQESSGELHRKSKIKVSEAAMLRGKLRDEALAWIVEGPENAMLAFGKQASSASETFDGGDFALDAEDAALLAQHNGSNGDSEKVNLGSVYPAGRGDEQLAKFLAQP